CRWTAPAHLATPCASCRATRSWPDRRRWGSRRGRMTTPPTPTSTSARPTVRPSDGEPVRAATRGGVTTTGYFGDPDGYLWKGRRRKLSRCPGHGRSLPAKLVSDSAGRTSFGRASRAEASVEVTAGLRQE